MKLRRHYLLLLPILLGLACQTPSASAPPTTKGFPFVLPKEKPNRPLSASLERAYTQYRAPRPEDNELYTQFRYTELKGFDYNGGDGT
ncbi:MAG: glycoside hydrolase, partial [Bacteroidota bacterium]